MKVTINGLIYEGTYDEITAVVDRMMPKIEQTLKPYGGRTPVITGAYSNFREEDFIVGTMISGDIFAVDPRRKLIEEPTCSCATACNCSMVTM